ncbi:hypothetical protein ACWDU1_15440, partial [Nocardia sp. NPDC003345]
MTGPLLRPGYLLIRDAVSTPRSYPTDAALGLGDAAPRAVPQDGLLAALSTVVDGGLLVKAILVAALWAAGYGAAVLTRDLLRAPLAAQLVAVTLALWNPYIAERLLQGHWSLLTGYAALPWTVLAATRLRTAARGSTADWATLAGCLAAAGLTPTGSLLAGVTALAVAGRRRFAGVLLVALLTCAPWLTATAVSGVAAEPSDPAGVAAFAARAEPGLATVGSLAGLGGIWNADAVPGSRTGPVAALATVLLLVIVLLGARRVAAADDDAERTRVRRTLLGLAAAAVVLPALAATPPGLAAMEWLVVEVPGAGLLRDTQKFVALAVPAYLLCAAAACTVLPGLWSPRTPSEENLGAPGSKLPESPADRPGSDSGSRTDPEHPATPDHPTDPEHATPDHPTTPAHQTEPSETWGWGIVRTAEPIDFVPGRAGNTAG